MRLLIRDLSVNYSARNAEARGLRDVALDVNTPERFAVMGPSGSGKSTLLRAVAGLVPVVSGTVEIDGRDMTDTPAHRRSVGFMFQDYALFPHMSVLQNIGYGPRMAGISADLRDKRSQSILELVGLDGFSDRNPATLSGGEQQRVALARTLAAEPSVVLLDEPLASLDLALRESLLAETRSILDSVGATSLLVTHDSNEAFAFCDRMAIIHDGTILRVGTPDEIWHDPQSIFTARAIGQSNLISLGILAPGWAGIGYVPLDAVTVNAHGRFSGTVRRSRFEKGSHIVAVELADAASTLDMRVPEHVRIGSIIRYDVHREGVIVVSVDEI